MPSPDPFRIFNPNESLASAMASNLVDGIAGVDSNQTEASAEIEEARAMCRAGNPFPLIALQWPEFVVKGPECRFFEGVEGDKVNPCLRFDWWQRLIFTAFFDPIYPEIFVKGCTGPGKGACVAIAVCLDFDVRDVAMWNITADTNKHASEVMFGEIMMWRKKMESPCYARELATAILANERKFITVLNPEKSSNGESFSGRHGSKYIFDESSSVPDVFYENACKNATKIVCISNPRTKVGFFRAGFRGLKSENKTGVTMGILGKRLCVTIGGLDCSNVKHERIKDPKSPVGGITIQGVEYPEGELIEDHHFQQVKALIPGQMDLNQYRSILKNAVEAWKKQCFALGMFPDEDPVLQFIMQSWLTKQFLYHDNNYLDIEVNSFGLDVARSLDGDNTTLSCGSWGGVRDIHKFKLETYPKIADRVIGIVGDYGLNLLDGTNPICIDYGGGYGSGVGDWIGPLGAWVIPQIPGGRAEVVPELYQNQRTEDYALLALRLDPAREWIDQPFGLPNESNLSEELLAVTKVWDKAMTRFGTLPKDAMKLAFQDGRSPDSGDSVALMFRAVRALEDMDGMLRSSVVSGELIVSHAGQTRSNESAGAVSRKANEVIDDLLGYYKERNRR